jgi:hypothetical protein
MLGPSTGAMDARERVMVVSGVYQICPTAVRVVRGCWRSIRSLSQGRMALPIARPTRATALSAGYDSEVSCHGVALMNLCLMEELWASTC